MCSGSPHLDQILALFRRESIYISSVSIGKRQPPQRHIENRSKTIDWFYTIVDYLQYDRDIVPIAVDYLDRCLISSPTAGVICIRTYKLIAMTSLYLAIKIHVGNNSQERGLCLQEYASLSKDLISPQDITSMERCILDTLSWRVHPVTPICFAHSLLMLITDSQYGIDKEVELNQSLEVLRKIALHFTELAISLPWTTTYFQLYGGTSFAPSTIAYTCILLSMEVMTYSTLPLVVRESFVHSCYNLSRGHHSPLQPNRKDVKELQVQLRKRVNPRLFLTMYAEESEVHSSTYKYSMVDREILNSCPYVDVSIPLRTSLSPSSCLMDTKRSPPPSPSMRDVCQHSPPTFTTEPTRKRKK